MRTLALSMLLTLAAPLALRAQSPYLVKDINAVTAANPASSQPGNFFRFGSRIFFNASTSGNGVELWSTDGTAAGTAQVADINPGSASSFPSGFTVVNGKLLFNARDVRNGDELWTTDGTAAGTRLVADIRTGSLSSAPSARIVYGDKMIFAADDGIDGYELWITDGTPAGTRFFKDLAPGPLNSNPSGFVLFHGLIYFAAGSGLWKSDGTEAGTVQVTAAAYVNDLVVAGSRLFFTGYTQATGDELWVSDGTEAGTRMVTDINSGPANSVSYGNTAFGDGVLFLGTDPQHGTELWISDGTASGTRVLRDIVPGSDSSYPSRPVVTDGGVAFFTAATSLEGRELWRTDGTESGTTLVRDIVPGPNSSAPGGLVASGNNIYLVASNGTYATLWVSDGTSSGTRQVHTKDRLEISSSALTMIDGVLYFAGANGVNGFEPWKSDGTDAGTSMIGNLARDAAPSSDPRDLVAAGDWVYFDAWDGSGPLSSGNGGPRSMWRSDGTPEGTLRIGDEFISNPISDGHTLYFTSSNALWTSDGTPEGTTAAAFPNNFPKIVSVIFVNGDTLFVSASVGSSYQLFGIKKTANAVPEQLGVQSVSRFIDQAGRTFFFADSGLWSSDGTRAGTYAVVPTIADNLTATGGMGGSIYYATQGTGGAKLWRSEGTLEGTYVIKVLPASATLFTVAERNLFFLSGNQLWVTDGTEAGTQALTAGQNIFTLAAAGSRVVFSANDAANGTELWASDGTVAGTHLLRDIFPGTFSSSPQALTSVRGAVYFSALDDLHGNEVWVTDGTAEGTKLAAEVEPGFGGSSPQQYVQAGDRLFFSVTTTATGNELWALPLPSTARLTVNDIRVTEGNSGTTTARFTVTLSAPSSQTVTADYATSDGTAVAGSDYDAVSGTLTFAPGETSKNVDVPVRGDVNAEYNETFFLTLRNPSGATLQKASGFAIIDDDDQVADLGLSLDFSSLSSLDVVVNATNNGPRAATNIRITHTATPADGSSSCAFVCSGALPQLASGETTKAFGYGWPGFQQYLTATVTLHERDPQPANNSVGWVTNAFMAMDALFLTPASQANVWFGSSNISSVSITSSDPAVISVPATLTFTAGHPATFIARGLSAGTATIRVFTPTFTVGTIAIDVVPAGTKPRWPAGVLAFADNGGTISFDSPIGFSISVNGTAPYTGERPTGIVTVSTNGHDLGHVVLKQDGSQQKVINYLPNLGANAIRVDYSGDANFLPTSLTSSVTTTIGRATILGGAERLGSSARVHIRVTGSPSAPPTGTITISEPGVISPVVAALTAGAPGEAQADIILPNVSAAPHTLVLTYSGDPHYAPSTQNTRMTDPRTRSVRH